MNQLVERSSTPCDSAVPELWFNDLPDDVRAFLDANPDLRRDKNVVVDLAYEEYCNEVEAGRPPDIEDFCDRFPTFRSTLRATLEAHYFAEEFPSLLTGGERVAWPIKGETFLGFQLLSELGHGALARVYLASEPAVGNRLVVVKVSPQGGHEAMILGQVEHPHVVPIYGVRTEPESGLTAVCMPYLSTETLANALDRAFANGQQPRFARVLLESVPNASAPPSPGARWLAPDPILTSGTYAEGVCLIGAQLADALTHVHERKILHRDLKPSNVLLGACGQPMLIDFNLSAEGAHDTARPAGTFPYMAPEAIEAYRDPTRPAPGPAADVFSLGVILFELLVGKRPYGQVDPLMRPDEICARLLAAQRAGVPALRSLCPQASPALARVVSQCLVYDPALRPTAAQLTAALRRDLSWWRRLPRDLRRHPRKLAAGAAVLTLLVAASLGAAAMRPPEQERLHSKAKRAYAEKRYDDSLSTLDPLVARHPDVAENHYLLGRVYLARGNWGQAEASFARAEALSPDGRAAACRAYALALTKEHTDAATAGREALDHKYETADVHNNLAYSYMHNRKLKEAEKSLNCALELNPHLPAANLNRLWLALAWMQSSSAKKRLTDVQPILDQSFELCPDSAEGYAVAARVSAAAGDYDSNWDVRVLPYLMQAHARGADFSSLDSDIAFKRFHEDARFKALLKPAAQTAPLKTARLVDPVTD